MICHKHRARFDDEQFDIRKIDIISVVGSIFPEFNLDVRYLVLYKDFA
jgi:hypothetical protein